MLFTWLTWNRESWFDSQRQSRRLRCLAMDYEYELVTMDTGTGGGDRAGKKVQCEPDADTSDKAEAGHRSGREKNAEVSAGECHDLNGETWEAMD